MKNGQKNIINNRLSYRLLLYILLCSVAFTCVATTVQLHLTYKKNLEEIENVMELIRDSYLKPLETSLWSYDIHLLSIQAKGLLALPMIKKAVISELSDGNVKETVSIGNIEDKRYIERLFFLIHMDKMDDKQKKKIGILKVYAGVDSTIEQIRNKALFIFMMKTVEILILSFCILFIFHHVIMKHLAGIALYLKNLDINNLDSHLYLHRKTDSKPDILDFIVSSVNFINHQLAVDIDQRKKVEAQLRKSNIELELNRIDIENQNHIKTARMAVADILRDEQSIETLGMRLTGYLCSEFRAGAGIFYYYDEIDDVIRGVSGYAVTDRDISRIMFKPGNGLVGQVFSDKKMMVTDLPVNDRLTIHSVLGRSLPRSLMIYPFIRENRVVCLIEIGSFRPFNPEYASILDQISESVAIAAESAAVRSQKNTLVEELNRKIQELGDRDLVFRQTEEKLKTVFGHSDHMLVFTDLNGFVTDNNDTASRYTARGMNKPIGEEIWNAFSWSEDGKNRLNRIFSGNIPVIENRQVFDISDENGRTIQYDIQFSPLFCQPDDLCGMFLDGAKITPE